MLLLGARGSPELWSPSGQRQGCSSRGVTVRIVCEGVVVVGRRFVDIDGGMVEDGLVSCGYRLMQCALTGAAPRMSESSEV